MTLKSCRTQYAVTLTIPETLLAIADEVIR